MHPSYHSTYRIIDLLEQHLQRSQPDTGGYPVLPIDEE